MLSAEEEGQLAKWGRVSHGAPLLTSFVVDKDGRAACGSRRTCWKEDVVRYR